MRRPLGAPLPSWIDGSAKAAIQAFVTVITNAGSDRFVPPADRIAVFDNDGTLWCEQPFQVQFYFGHDRLMACAEQEPALREQQPYKAFLENDREAILRLGKRGLFEAAAVAHAGMTEDEFDQVAREWLASARHPNLGRPFTELVYRPQFELLNYLRANGFRTYIVSGGGVDLMRAFSADVYGVPPTQVIGSSVRTRFEMRDGRAVLVKLPEIASFDDREEKVVNIGLHIGRRPILAFGNSDGDLAMLRYVLTGSGPSLALLLHHDDPVREFAYDRDFQVSPLAEALDQAAQLGIRVVSMKNDWARVF